MSFGAGVVNTSKVTSRKTKCPVFLAHPVGLQYSQLLQRSVVESGCRVKRSHRYIDTLAVIMQYITYKFSAHLLSTIPLLALTV